MFDRKRWLCPVTTWVVAAYVCSTHAKQVTASSTMSSSSSSTDKGLVEVQSFCDANKIKVLKVVLLCDSPGAYYYGSTTYRNSQVCMSNDRVNLEVYFTITDRYEGSNLRLHLESGIYNSYTTIFNAVNVCELGITDENVDLCPNSGDYVLKTYYTLPAIRDYYFHYTPDARLTFFDGDAGTILACVAVGTGAVHKRQQSAANQGLVALGICTAIFCVIFGVLLYLSYRRKKRVEQLLRDNKQSASHYNMRTLPNNGQLNLPVQERTVLPEHFDSGNDRIRDDHGDNNYGNQMGLQLSSPCSVSSDDILDIRNPMYNETQMPTRPVI